MNEVLLSMNHWIVGSMKVDRGCVAWVLPFGLTHAACVQRDVSAFLAHQCKKTLISRSSWYHMAFFWEHIVYLLNWILFFFHISVSHLCVLFGKCLFGSSAHRHFLLLSYMSYLCILDMNPLTDVSFANICSHSLDCLFILLFFFAVQFFSLV